MAEQFPQALKDFQRVKRLGLKGKEAELWTYAAETMSGLATREHALGGGRGAAGQEFTPGIVSVPGHIIQGRGDYPTEYASFVIYQMAMPIGKMRQPERFGGGGNPTAQPTAQRLAVARPEGMKKVSILRLQLSFNRRFLMPAITDAQDRTETMSLRAAVQPMLPCVVHGKCGMVISEFQAEGCQSR